MAFAILYSFISPLEASLELFSGFFFDLMLPSTTIDLFKCFTAFTAGFFR